MSTIIALRLIRLINPHRQQGVEQEAEFSQAQAAD